MSSENSSYSNEKKAPSPQTIESIPSADSPTAITPDTAPDAAPVAPPVTKLSFGIRKAEFLTAQYNTIPLRIILLISIFFVAYAFSLDLVLRGNLTLYATSSYRNHSGFTTIGVYTAVIGGITQPVYARLSDRFGRFEIFIISIVLYSVGTIIQSQAYNFDRFAVGSVLFQIGLQGVRDMLQVILGDFTNLNWRLVTSFIPVTPHLINTWAGGDVMQVVLAKYSWQWGIGMWSFIFPLSCIPLVCCYVHMLMKVRKEEGWHELNREIREERNKRLVITLFWEVDVIGMVLIMVSLACMLVPFTIAGGTKSQWQKASIIVPMVIGVVLFPCFILWEARFAKSPILPLPLMRDRGVWAPICIAMLVYWVRDMPNEFIYTVLVVGMNTSVKAATRIARLFVFVGTSTGLVLGLVVSRVRRVKIFIVFGSMVWFGAMGILIHFRGSQDGVEYKKYVDGVIGGLVALGFGASFINFPSRVAISTVTNHEYMGVMISFYLASYSIGSGVGSAVSGAIWTQKMYSLILRNMALQVYENPFKFITDHAWGTPARMAVVLAYSEVQRILCIVGLVLCVPVLLCALLVRDHKLESVQSLEGGEIHQISKKSENVVMVNKYDDDIIFNYFRKLFGKAKKNES
ncbi:SIT1 Siderophore iron transporter 1 [Candida maltosa Xu316]